MQHPLPPNLDGLRAVGRHEHRHRYHAHEGRVLSCIAIPSTSVRVNFPKPLGREATACGRRGLADGG